MKQTSTSINMLNGEWYNEKCVIFYFFLFYFFAHTLINNEWPPMKIHTHMIKLCPHTDVTWIITNKTISQTEIAEPLPMGWTGGKNVTIFHAVMCEKPPLKGNKDSVEQVMMRKKKKMSIISGDMWCRKIVMKRCQSGKYHNEEWEMMPKYACQV